MEAETATEETAVASAHEAAAEVADQGRNDAFPSWLALLLTVVALAAGLRLLAAGGRDSLGAGVLCLVGALAFGAVALAQGPYGAEVEGRLDLSARLGLGFLGGVLGAVGVRIAVWLTASSGILRLLGLRVGTWESAIVLGPSTGQALLWGVIFGVLYRYVPGESFAARGAFAGTLAALYLLFKTLPLDVSAGWLGVAIGPLAFLAVLTFGLVWGLACAATISWGQRDDQAPVSRYLSQPAA